MFASAVFILCSCNSGGTDKEETKAQDTTATATPVTPAPPQAFTPFKILIAHQEVKNFEKWKAGYMAHDSMRKAYGISNYVIGRGMPDSNMAVVIDKINDLQKAKEFSTMPNLKEVMKNAGVIGTPTFSFVDVVRNDDSNIDQKDRIMVIHHVKNYDAWLKEYDKEGKNTRAENGLLDRGLGRGADDSNMVYIVFAVTDIAKAKARMASPELKKIMTEAGVEGVPKIYTYQIVDKF